MVKFKSILTFSLSVFFLTGTSSHARLPIEYYKQFHGNDDLFPSLNPILGRVAVNEGLIYNLRFFGNFTSGINQDGERLYRNDSSTDPLWNVVKILFPSPAGMLCTSTNADANLGKYIKDSKSVSLLIKLCTLFRYGSLISGDQGPTYEKIRSDYLGGFIGSLVGGKEKSSSTKKALKKASEELFNHLEQSIKQEGTSIYPRFTTEQVILAFLGEHFNTREDFLNYYLGLKWDFEHHKDVKLVDDQIVMDLKKNMDTTDYQEFDYTRKDILSIKSSIDNEEIITVLEALAYSYLQNQYKSSNSLSILYPTSDPIQNGRARAFNRSTGEILNTVQFADCGETAIRHIFNFLLFSPKDDQFDLSHLSALLNDSPLTNLIEFYKNHSALDVNDGSEDVRDRWSWVVGDLNAATDNQIKYVKNTSDGASYELKSGFLNHMKVFKALLSGISLSEDVNSKKLNLESILDNPSVAYSEKQRPLLNYMELVFGIINPNYHYSIRTIDQLSENDDNNDLIGMLNVYVTPAVQTINDDNFFSFRINQKNSHAFVSLKKEEEDKYRRPRFYTPYLGDMKSSLGSIKLCFIPDYGQKGKKELLGFYDLFGKQINNNDDIISKFRELCLTNLEDSEIKNNFIEHLLENYDWNDERKVKELSIHFKAVSLYSDLSEGCFNKVKKIVFSKISNEHFSAVKNYKNTKKIILRKSTLNDLSALHNLENLEELFIDRCTINSLTPLEGLNSLKELMIFNSEIGENLEWARNLTTLETLSIRNHTVRSTSCIENLVNLKHLCLSDGKLSFVEGIEKLAHLEKLDLSDNKDLTDVIGLSFCKKLVSINLRDTSLSELSWLKKCESLERLNVSSTNIRSLDGIGEAKRLKDLDISYNATITGSEYLKNLSSLEVLAIADSTIDDFQVLSGLPNLKEVVLTTENYNAVRQVLGGSDRIYCLGDLEEKK